MDTVKRVGVLGAGMMGAEIGLCFALSGREVLLADMNLDLANAGKKRLAGILGKWEEKGKMTKEEGQKVLSRITALGDYSGFETVDLVIEAVIEEIETKKKVFHDLDNLCKGTCIFASNTSSISISSLAGSTSRAGQFIGMHFFSPASVMKLVEVIPGLDTAEETIRKIMEIAREIGKEPIRVKDCAGFVVNRLLFAFFNESWRLLSEGVASPEDIDKAVKLGLGHPVGVFQLQDIGGLDLAVSVSKVLYEEYGERFKASPLLKRKVEANHVGRKAKRGWYDYR